MVKIKKQSEAPFFVFLLKKIHNPLFTILLNVTCPFENKCFDQPLIFFKTPASHSRIHKFGKCLALLLRPFGLSVKRTVWIPSCLDINIFQILTFSVCLCFRFFVNILQNVGQRPRVKKLR